MISNTRKKVAAAEKKALTELLTMQRKVLAGESVPNFEYNKMLRGLRKIRRGNWRVFQVSMTVEAQSDWTIKEVREHLETVLENSLLRRYSAKVRTVEGKGSRSL